jgi:hypothetical protein
LSTEREEDEAIYAGIPGGHDLIAWFGCVPSFHDAEVLSVSLNRKGPSILRIDTWNMVRGGSGSFGIDKRATVTITIEDIIDLQIEGMSKQNVIYRLKLRRAQDDPERAPYYTLEASPDDYEIELEHCYGISGEIRFRKVSVSFVPGEPQALD